MRIQIRLYFLLILLFILDKENKQNGKVSDSRKEKELNNKDRKMQKKEGLDPAKEYRELARQEAEWHRERAKEAAERERKIYFYSLNF